jgi:branched-chain amino acid transport system substrate-binding protein
MRLPDWLSSSLFCLCVLLCAGLSPLCAQADIVVAATGNLNTGQILRGVESAVEAINRSGGLLGQKLQLVRFDGACDERQGRDLANRVVQQRAQLVVGLDCSDAAIAAAPVYAEHGVVQISALSSNPRLTEMGFPTTFRLLGRDDRQAEAAAEMIVRKWGATRVALVYDDTVYGRDLGHDAREAFVAKKIDTRLELQAKSGARSYADVVAALKKKKIDLVYVTFSASRDLGLLMRELSKSDVKLTVMSGDIGAAVGRWVSGGAGNLPLLFTFCRQPAPLAAAHPLAGEVGEADIDLNNQLRRVYAAVEVWAEAARIAGSLQGDHIAKVLHERQFQTAIGEVSFDRKGDVQGPAAEWQWFHPIEGRMVRIPDGE